MTVTGKKADHSDLPQNDQVIQIIRQYLLETNKFKNNQSPAGQAKEKDNNRGV